MRSLRKLFGIQRGEGKAVLILFAYFFFFGAALTVGKTARDAYFLNRFDTDYLPLMFVAVAVVVALTVVFYNYLSRRLGLVRIILFSGIFFALTLVLAQFHLKGWVIPVLYVWMDVITTVMSVQFWLLAGTVFNSRQAKRLFGFILSGSPIARILIGAGVPLFIDQLGSEYLLSVSSLFILCCVAMVGLIQPYVTSQDKQRRDVLEQPQTSEKRRFLDRYLTLIAVSVGAAAVATVIVEYQFLIASVNSFPSEAELASFFGIFYAVTGGVSLVTQLFLTRWVLGRFGILPGLLMLPIGLTAGSIATLISPLLPSVLVSRTADQITKFTVNKTSQELLWVPVSPERKQRTKLFIDGTVRTTIQGTAGILIFLFVRWLPEGTIMRALSIIAISATAIWMAVSFWLRQGYVQELMAAIEKRRLDFTEQRLDTTDQEIVETIGRTLHSGEEAKQAFALDLIENLYLTPWAGRLNQLLHRAAPMIRRRVLSMSADEPEIVPNEELTQLIQMQDPLATDALIILGKRETSAAEVVSREVLQEQDASDPELLAAAATAQLLIDGTLAQQAKDLLLHMLGDTRVAQRNIASRMLVHVPTFLSKDQLQDLLLSESVAIRSAALEILQESKPVGMLPPIIQNLASPHTAALTRRTLLAYPQERVVQALIDVEDAPGTPVLLQSEILKTLKAYPTDVAIDHLLNTLTHRRPSVVQDATDSLMEIARQRGLPSESWEQINARKLAAARSIYLRLQLISLLQETRTTWLLRDSLAYEVQREKSLLVKLALIHAPETPIESYLALIERDNTAKTADVLEILDHLLMRSDKAFVNPLLEPLSLQERCAIGQRLFPEMPQSLNEELVRWVESEDTWWSLLALDVVVELFPPLLEHIDWERVPLSQYHKELLHQVRARYPEQSVRFPSVPPDDIPEHTEEMSMLSSLEKTIILKETEIFAEIPGEEVLHMSQIVDETRLEGDSVLFHEGDSGDYLYIIVTGEILIHIGDREVNRLGQGEYFGEMALLDEAPRSTSATATEETLLLRIERDDFYGIMASRLEVLKGILRVLTQRIRRLTDRYVQSG